MDERRGVPFEGCSRNCHGSQVTLTKIHIHTYTYTPTQKHIHSYIHVNVLMHMHMHIHSCIYIKPYTLNHSLILSLTHQHVHSILHRELEPDHYSVWHAWAVTNYDQLKKLGKLHDIPFLLPVLPFLIVQLFIWFPIFRSFSDKILVYWVVLFFVMLFYTFSALRVWHSSFVFYFSRFTEFLFGDWEEDLSLVHDDLSFKSISMSWYDSNEMYRIGSNDYDVHSNLCW